MMDTHKEVHRIDGLIPVLNNTPFEAPNPYNGTYHGYGASAPGQVNSVDHTLGTSEKRIAGLRIATFWLLLALAAVIALSVGLGTGIGLGLHNKTGKELEGDADSISIFAFWGSISSISFRYSKAFYKPYPNDYYQNSNHIVITNTFFAMPLAQWPNNTENTRIRRDTGLPYLLRQRFCEPDDEFCV
ncbi:hypothetical protein E0Z10_g195 [Xylaria hypoxylon]|uniref:Uncharacterized protein n=1 Tax=Xylaria hypoxylon TaxID=37992 RepID=A0A4Z0YWN7_9PEZI|nr:hypothetical protein E0Z10_g195 [Xylaria hypoxylon]